MSVKEYVEKARKDGASDIHLVRGLTPRYRVDGAIREMEGGSWQELEEGAYLIEAAQSEVTLTLEPADERLYR